MDFPQRIKKIRAELQLTQERLAELLGVSFATVNRWENGQSRPSSLALQKITRIEKDGIEALSKPVPTFPGVREPSSQFDSSPGKPVHLDFSSDPEIVRTFIEAERLKYGHRYNPVFATEISRIDPLPHQRIAVYDRMLKQPRLRFLLADDAGAGKTIMSGLYIREMLARRLICRVLIVPPAGLVGNWQREMRNLFGLFFKIVQGSDAKSGSPFTEENGDLIIVSVDTLAGVRMFSRLKEPLVRPYDLVIFDESHKLAADREPDFRVRKTDRYRLGEALAGVHTGDIQWSLPWSARHLLLLTATPHMGKDYPYYCLWRLLEPETLSTYEAFQAFPVSSRTSHFIRRTKEEMVYFDGKPLYPRRISDTLSFDLTQGEISEQRLYNQTTDYLRVFYNRARILNRSAARLAMAVFQRRLVSSTYALLCSFERRLAKLDGFIKDIKEGRLTPEQRTNLERSLEEVPDAFDEMTSDEESPEDGNEQNEILENQALGSVVALSLADLETERNQVETLVNLARCVYEKGEESKFEKLMEVLRDPRFKDEKIIVFTEHRDTLTFITRKMEGLGFTGKIARIHGGMAYPERDEQILQFKKPVADGGAVCLIATDAAGEGINLQFCWLMVNYDIPWNPARLEQRMGRIHRYLQTHDPVYILNLVAGKTREGKVMQTLLKKLEKIREELGSDKVFDVIGRLFEGISFKEYMEQALTDEGATETVRRIEGSLTKEQVEALRVREKQLYGDGGDVKSVLPTLRTNVEREIFRRLLPGYVRRFFEKAAPLLGIGLEGNPDTCFGLKPLKTQALEPFWPVLETYPENQRQKFSFSKPAETSPAIFLHPGDTFFDSFQSCFSAHFQETALRGAVFVDALSDRSYLFFVLLTTVLRKKDQTLSSFFVREEILEYRLVGVKYEAIGGISECPVEHLLFLKGAQGIPPEALSLVAKSASCKKEVLVFARESIARCMMEEHRQAMLQALPDRLDLLKRGFDFQEAELAETRTRISTKAQNGDSRAKAELSKIKELQKNLQQEREDALARLRREPELVDIGEIAVVAGALILPSQDPEAQKHQNDEIEAIAMKVAWGYEESNGAIVRDVSKPEGAWVANLDERPGFDLLSMYSTGEQRAIEVKGRAKIGDIELTENEWAKACNLREGYWLYVVFDCASPHPRLFRIRDPFARLLAKAKGGVIIEESEIMNSNEENV